MSLHLNIIDKIDYEKIHAFDEPNLLFAIIDWCDLLHVFIVDG
ncbi:hypothetical protein SPWS13_2985 [Shewanella putrefaciens]|nr:hypothetical protein SPWS13_2985 [Shewanella putrefaciens]